MGTTKKKDEEKTKDEAIQAETPEETPFQEIKDTSTLNQASPEEIDFRDPPASNDLTTEEREAAASEHITEGLMVGNVAEATRGKYKGDFFAITRIVKHGSVADLVRNAAGSPQQLYNTPEEVEGSFIGGEYDSQTTVLNVEESGLVKAPESWRGTRAGRRH